MIKQLKIPYSEFEPLSNKNIIKNISYNQNEILSNIIKLYNGDKPFDCDMTASTLNFYKQRKNSDFNIPMPKYLFDVFPINDKIQKITPFKALPLDNSAIHSIVVDLPFVISPKRCKSMIENKKGSQIIAKRFSSWYPYTEFYANCYWWFSEIDRVLDDGGICVFKMQDTISGSINHQFVEFSKLCGQRLGLYVIDEFFLLSKARLIGKIKRQCHARKYTSSFIVFKKDKKVGNKVSPLTLLDWCEESVKEGMEFELK